jgi:hypothetical protein
MEFDWQLRVPWIEGTVERHATHYWIIFFNPFQCVGFLEVGEHDGAINRNSGDRKQGSFDHDIMWILFHLLAL